MPYSHLECVLINFIRSGTPANVSGEEVPPLSSPPTEEVHSDDSNSGLQNLDDLPGPSGTTEQPVNQAHHTPPQSLPHLETPPQHPPSIPIPLSPEHANQQCAHLYRDHRAHFAPKTIRDLKSVAVGTPFRGQRHRQPGTWEDCWAPGGGQAQATDSPGGTHRDPGSLSTFPGHNGPDPGQRAGEQATAGGTVPEDQGGLASH
ncbi:hypothetical protein NDU88_001126 [Pleurodeles waltl]|uniref:Uncharacterized protein n=1 Tax=Pleurodeles waltl TaxID=8319 RepID=A0AAV7WNC4_PLEWA|nr:hypothetical protein NDU88_001126 [Pleurodeles waltl]